MLCSEEEKGRTRAIGFTESTSPVASSEVRVDALSASEMMDATAGMIRSMIAVMKRNHSRYASLADDPGVPDSERGNISGPGDMEQAARRVILSLI